MDVPNWGAGFWSAYRMGQDARAANQDYDVRSRALAADAGLARATADADTAPPDDSTSSPASGTSDGGYAPTPAPDTSGASTPAVPDPSNPDMGSPQQNRVGGPVADIGKLKKDPDSLPAAKEDDDAPADGSSGSDKAPPKGSFSDMLKDLSASSNQQAIPTPAPPAANAPPPMPSGSGAPPAQAIPTTPVAAAPPPTQQTQAAAPATTVGQAGPTQLPASQTPASQAAQAIPAQAPVAQAATPQGSPVGARPLAPGMAAPTNPNAPAVPQPGASQPSLGASIMNALNPISSASAAESPVAPPPGTKTIPASDDPDVAARAANDAAGYNKPSALGQMVSKAGSAVSRALSPGDDDPDAAPYLGTAPTSGATPAAKGALPAPAKAAATTTAPASQGASQTQAGTTALPAPEARVAPSQEGPSQQSEAPVAYPKQPIDPRPLAALADQAPKYYKMINNIAEQYGISPDRLAAHWSMESQLSDKPGITHTNKNGTVDIGPFQINSDTLKQLDPSGKLNPDTPEGGAELAARYIKGLDARFGKDTFLSVAGYNGGPGAADDIYAGKGNPAVINYAKTVFMGRTPNQLQPPMQAPNPQQIVQAAQQGGPNGAIQLIANSNPNVSMGDKWRNVEMASLQAAYDRNDGAGAAQIRDQILQLQHAGANQNIQNAYAALQTGNGVAAAQFLAKAHAFIPDNVMGRFGVDKSGKVWGEMLDEGTGKPVGKAFPVDSNSLGALMVQTRDINKFNALTTQNEKEQAQIKFTQDHGNYYGDLIQARQEATQERATAATQRVNALNFDAVTRANAATANAYMRQRGALGGGMVQPAKQSDINKELANPAMTPAVNAIADPSMRSAASSAYNDLRGSGHSTQDADHYLGGLMAGQYVLRSMPGSPFGYVTTPDKRPVMGNDGRPVKVSPHVADMLRNSLPHAQANQAMRHSALTMGAASSAYPPSSSALH